MYTSAGRVGEFIPEPGKRAEAFYMESLFPSPGDMTVVGFGSRMVRAFRVPLYPLTPLPQEWMGFHRIPTQAYLALFKSQLQGLTDLVYINSAFGYSTQ